MNALCILMWCINNPSLFCPNVHILPKHLIRNFNHLSSHRHTHTHTHTHAHTNSAEECSGRRLIAPETDMSMKRTRCCRCTGAISSVAPLLADSSTKKPSCFNLGASSRPPPPLSSLPCTPTQTKVRERSC